MTLITINISQIWNSSFSRYYDYTKYNNLASIGSVVIDSVTGTKTVRNFQNTETVFVYDTQRDGTGSPMLNGRT